MTTQQEHRARFMAILAAAGYPKLVGVHGDVYPNAEIKRDGPHHVRVITQTHVFSLSVDDITRIEVTDSAIYLK